MPRAMDVPVSRVLLFSIALLATVCDSWARSKPDPEADTETYPEGLFEAPPGPPLTNMVEMADMDEMTRNLDMTKIIYPGTKYCGPGNIADTVIPPERYLAAEDACCKAHDECPNYIPAGQTDPTSGLTNNCVLSQSDCTCEDTFFKCLKTIGSYHANVIGSIYFSGLTRKCYTNDVPVKCKPLLFWLPLQPTTCRKCFNYCTDTTAATAWHWRPTAIFKVSNTALTQPPAC